MNNERLEAALISEVRLHPNLYDKAALGFRDRDLKETTWAAIGRMFGLPSSEIIHRWTLLRENYAKKTRELALRKASGGPLTMKSWVHWEAMTYFEKFIKRRNRYHVRADRISTEIESRDPLAFDQSLSNTSQDEATSSTQGATQAQEAVNFVNLEETRMVDVFSEQPTDEITSGSSRKRKASLMETSNEAEAPTQRVTPNSRRDNSCANTAFAESVMEMMARLHPPYDSSALSLIHI